MHLFTISYYYPSIYIKTETRISVQGQTPSEYTGALCFSQVNEELMINRTDAS